MFIVHDRQSFANDTVEWAKLIVLNNGSFGFFKERFEYFPQDGGDIIKRCTTQRSGSTDQYYLV